MYILNSTYSNYIRRDANIIKKNYFLFMLELFIEDHRWFHANPTIYKDKRYNDIYNKYIMKDPLDKYVENLNNYLYEKSQKIIFITGRRGSGKTTFLNYFLNTQTRNMNKKKKTWIRIDVTKIYRNNLDIFNKKVDLTFEKYLYAQLLYVVSRYGAENPSLNMVSESIPLDNHDEVLFEIKKKFIKTLNTKDLGIFKSIEQRCINADNFSDSLSEKPFDSKYLEIGRKLWGMAKKDIFIIIDGIDNVDYNSNIIENMYHDLLQFIHKMHDNHMIIALRNELSILIAKKLEGNNRPNEYQIDISNRIEIDQDISLSVYIEDIIKKNIEGDGIHDFKYADFIIEFCRFINDTNIDKLICDKGIQKIEKQLQKDLFIYDYKLFSRLKAKGHHYIRQLANALIILKNEQKHPFYSQLYSLFFGDFLIIYENTIRNYFSLEKEENICKIVFNNDFREMLLNYLKSFNYCIYNFNQKYKSEYIDIIDFFNSDTLKQILISGILKNGNLYCVGYDEITELPPFRNINFINFFHLKTSKHVSYTPPLLVYYILQYMATQQEKQNLVTVDSLNKLFRRNTIQRSEIKSIIFRLFEFGYIEFKEGMQDSDMLTNDTFIFTITKKGSLLTQKLVEDLDFIHIQTYNGFMTNGIASHLKRFKPNFSNYVDITLYNSLLLLYDIYVQSKQINDMLENDEYQLSFNKQILTTKLFSKIKSYMSKLKIDSLSYLFSDIDNDELKNKLQKFIEYTSLDLQTTKINIRNLYDIKLSNNLDEKLKFEELILLLLFYFKYSIEDILNSNDLNTLLYEDQVNKYTEPEKYLKKIKEIKRIKDDNIGLIDSRMGSIIKKTENLKLALVQHGMQM